MIGGLCHFDFAIEEGGGHGDTGRKGADTFEAVLRTVGSHLVIIYNSHS